MPGLSTDSDRHPGCARPEGAVSEAAGRKVGRAPVPAARRAAAVRFNSGPALYSLFRSIEK